VSTFDVPSAAVVSELLLELALLDVPFDEPHPASVPAAMTAARNADNDFLVIFPIIILLKYYISIVKPNENFLLLPAHESL
jgi:hypothetical protein